MSSAAALAQLPHCYLGQWERVPGLSQEIPLLPGPTQPPGDTAVTGDITAPPVPRGISSKARGEPGSAFVPAATSVPTARLLLHVVTQPSLPVRKNNLSGAEGDFQALPRELLPIVVCVWDWKAS